MTEKVDQHIDPKRINGLIAEDRIRTTNMFVKGNIAEHPTHEIDISPEADLIQGLPTHVKITKQTYRKDGLPEALNIDMACAYKLFSLEGYHRLLIMVYEEEPGQVIDGRKRTVLRFDKIIEIILSPETLDAFRGEISLVEMARIRELLLGWNPVVMNSAEAEIEADKARKRFHPMTYAMRPRQGIAHPSVKISINKTTLKVDNKRIQSTISVADTVQKVLSEGTGSMKGMYRGRRIQPRYIVHDQHSGFHGLSLPWRTTAHWSKLKRAGQIVPKVKETPIAPQNDPFDKYVESWIDVEQYAIPDGSVVIMTHEDGMVTVHAQSKLDDVRKHVSRVCKANDGVWIERIKSWLMDPIKAQRSVEILRLPRMTPGAPLTSQMQDQSSVLKPARSGKPDVFEFETPDGLATAIRFGNEKWFVRPDKGEREKIEVLLHRIERACQKNGVGYADYSRKYNRWSWILPQNPADLIEKVARDIQTI